MEKVWKKALKGVNGAFGPIRVPKAQVLITKVF